jgi:peptidase E
MEPDNPLLDAYIIGTSAAENPRICFLPTACGDSQARIDQFYEAFGRLDCRPTHLTLFRDPSRREEQIRDSDILYVGGGNTRIMLAVWRLYGVDRLVREAWESGTVLAGLSAGAICWFEEGVTDSDGPLGAMECLGFLSGSCVPHYDGETERRPTYHRLLEDGKIRPGLALDDGAAARFTGTERTEVVTSRTDARAWSVSVKDGKAVEETVPVRYLGERGRA